MFMWSVYKDGVEVHNALSSSSASAVSATTEASCVVGDKLSCGIVLSDDDEKQCHVYFLKNDHKV